MAAHRPGGRFVFAALILTLALAGLLGVNVLVTARYHRSVAEGVLRDYADFAAAELGNRIRTGLAQRIFPLLSGLAQRPGLPEATELAAHADSTVWRAVGGDIALFQISPRGFTTAGAPIPEPIRTLLADTVPKHARALLSRQAYLALLWLPTDSIGRVAAIVQGGSGLTAGILLPASAIAALLEPLLERAPLLPPSLTDGARLDSAVTYRIDPPIGRHLIKFGDPGTSAFRAVRTLEPMWGGLRLGVALDERLAGRLVIGGLPRSRLPVVLALLAVAALLTGTAWYQLGRERDLVRQREEFVAAVSHELRTPLAQIRLFAETLRLGRVRTEEERVQSVEIIDREALRLGQLVENLLTVSRTDRGTLAIARREVDLAQELREAVASFAPVASARGVAVTVAAPERLIVAADPDAFRQILLNLIDNAVKYGPRGDTVTASLAGGDGVARLTVEDGGPGIPPPDRLRIFERFVRLDRDRGAAVPGTGLGLALVRELVGLHGGRVWVEAAATGGARFVAELPITLERG